MIEYRESPQTEASPGETPGDWATSRVNGQRLEADPDLLSIMWGLLSGLLCGLMLSFSYDLNDSHVIAEEPDECTRSTDRLFALTIMIISQFIWLTLSLLLNQEALYYLQTTGTMKP